MSGVKRLSLNEMETWKRKAAAFDDALKYLDGRASTDEGVTVLRILKEAVLSRPALLVR